MVGRLNLSLKLSFAFEQIGAEVLLERGMLGLSLESLLFAAPILLLEAAAAAFCVSMGLRLCNLPLLAHKIRTS